MNLEDNLEIIEKSINELEGKGISKKPEFDSFTVIKTFELTNKKIKLLKPEDLRLLIGQNIGLKYLVPIAIEILKENPLIETDYFEGDLLIKVLNVQESFWDTYPGLKSQILQLFKNNLIDYNSLDEDTKSEIYSLYEKLE